MKNGSTHNFAIHYPISMNKKTKDMAFQALQNSHKFSSLAPSSIANDSQPFPLKWTHVVFQARPGNVFPSGSNDVPKVIIWFIAN
jgi:hypothetical protein